MFKRNGSSFKRSFLAAAVAAILLAPVSLRAGVQQSSRGGRVEGVVADAAGGAVVSANVQLQDPAQAVISSTRTDAEGRFAFENIAPGSYVVQVTRNGFSTLREVARSTQGGVTRLDLIMTVNQITEHVTVTAETGVASDKDRVPQQVNVIPDDAVRQRTTAVLAQVAEEEVGASMQRTSPTIGAVLVRGLTEVGVYVDGVRYTNSTQRGGINTFFNLNDPTSLRTVELLRGPNTAQYGSDSLGGTVQLISHQPQFGFESPQTHGEFNAFFTSADFSHGSNALVTYGTRRFGILGNAAARRINTLRTGKGIDSHSAITRFLGLPSDVLGETRLPDTAFTQYSGTLHLTFAPTTDQQMSFRYQRSQQDGGKRYDQLLGGDGNLTADLRNLMLDFFYARYFKQNAGFFDSLSATVSYNSQREERVNQGGQGNPLASINHDFERTSAYGFSFYLDKQFSARHTFLIGGDLYGDRVRASSFSVNPSTNASTLTRPRVPDGARYILAGAYIQDAFDAIPNRLRLSGALRYNVASYESRASSSPLVNNQPLWPDDSLRVADLSGRAGAVATLAKNTFLAFNYSRGFRAPNITNLGSLGLVGVGFQVATADVLNAGATVGSTADENAVSTGIPVSPLKSETSDNFDLSIRYSTRRFDTDLTGFVINYGNTITRQTLILPQGATGMRLGSQIIERQGTNGAVFVPLSASPVLVQVNFGDTRISGVEYMFNYRATTDWILGGNYTFIRAEERETGEPPNLGGGGIPPQTGFLRLRYQPVKGSYWIEAYTTLAGRQDRLSSLDLADRRTGASRSRTSIQNFFRRGACVRGLTTPGTNGQCGSSGGTLLSTGETLSQVQRRLLGAEQSAPLFTQIPGYGLFGLRGGFRFYERHEFTLDFENIGDKNYRAPGWGVDGPGRSVTARYRYRF